MQSDRQTTPQTPAAPPARAGSALDVLMGFEGPPEQFLQALLDYQCRLVGAQGGALFRGAAGGGAEAIVFLPPSAKAPPAWLRPAAEAATGAMARGESIAAALPDPGDLYGQPPRRQLLAANVRQLGGSPGAIVAVVEGMAPAAARDAAAKLELSSALMSVYGLRLSWQRRQADFARLRSAMEALSAVNDQDRAVGSSMAFCNELATAWAADRVSLGLLRGRCVRVVAMSHTEKFRRRTEVVQEVEGVMEECLDQDSEIVVPAPEGGAAVCRAATQYAARVGPAAVLSLPLRLGGEVVGVVTLERPADRPFTQEEVEALRLTCDLCARRVVELQDRDRWFGARWAAGARKLLAALLGPRHTWAKVAAVLLAGVAAFLIFAKGEYQAEGSFVLEPARKQIIQPPFDGQLQRVEVDVGAVVREGQLLAEMDTTDLRGRLAEVQAQLAVARIDADKARGEGKQADVKIALAQADQASAQIALLEYHIDQARIVAPFAGRILSGDWKHQFRPPVKTDQTLFELAPTEGMRAELSVPEDQIAEVAEKSTGELATASYPQRRIGFVVERIEPLARVEGTQNVFRVRVRLDETPEWLRPGMEGVARVDLGRRAYGWLWTRRLANWVRMKLWW